MYQNLKHFRNRMAGAAGKSAHCVTEMAAFKGVRNGQVHSSVDSSKKAHCVISNVHF